MTVPATSVPPLRALTTLIVLECLFTLVGGYTDVYAFLAHNHVFANAQTGNVVLLAASLAERDWPQALRYLPPILACIVGVTTARLLGARSPKQTFTATLICLAVELLAVGLLLFLDDRLPQFVFAPTLSFVAALQITSFDMLGPWRFNTAMTTGNLKSAVSGFVLWLRGEQPQLHRGQAIVAAAACLAFLLGALAGAVLTRRYPHHALLPCLLLLLAAFALVWRQHSRASSSLR